MAFLGKEYKYERHEKFDEFLASLGTPKEGIDTILANSYSEKLVKDGDAYTLTKNGYDGVKTLTFKSGVEFDEKIANFNAKTTFVVDGNSVVHTQKFPDGRTITFKKEFTDNKLAVTKMARSYMLALADEERLKVLLILNRRHLRDTSNPLQLPAHEFVGYFRLTKNQYLLLCDELVPMLPDRRQSAVQPEIKILAALAVYGNTAHQRIIGGLTPLSMSQTIIHDCLWEVTDALNHPTILKKFIKFPMTREERASVSRSFMDQFEVPGVIGCIDGTHVGIIRPTQNEEAYFNRKLYHSLNVLIICDANLDILHVDASFGGSSHDSHVWNLCPVQIFMRQLHGQGDNCWLLGDSGYAQRNYLMTPILRAEPGSPEEYYTRCHVRTRNVVERCIGVLKSRWRCLSERKGLHYTPIKAGKIVNACVVLHNLAKDASSYPIDPVIDRDMNQLQIHIPYQGPQSGPNNIMRHDLVQRLWNNRRN